MSLTRTESSPITLLRPFLWLAVAAFLLGFFSYMAAGAGGVAKAYARGHGSVIDAELSPPAR